MITATTTPRFTIADVLAMGVTGLFDDRWIELRGGTLVEMPPPGPEHSFVITQLQSRFVQINAERRLLVEKPLAIPDDDLLIPDLAVLRRPVTPRLMTPADCELIVEVSNRPDRHGRVGKIETYLTAGGSEVWLMSIPHRTVDVYRSPSLLPVGIVRLGEDIEADVAFDWPVINTGWLFEGLP